MSLIVVTPRAAVAFPTTCMHVFLLWYFFWPEHFGAVPRCDHTPGLPFSPFFFDSCVCFSECSDINIFFFFFFLRFLQITPRGRASRLYLAFLFGCSCSCLLCLLFACPCRYPLQVRPSHLFFLPPSLLVVVFLEYLTVAGVAPSGFSNSSSIQLHSGHPSRFVAPVFFAVFFTPRGPRRK